MDKAILWKSPKIRDFSKNRLVFVYKNNGQPASSMYNIQNVYQKEFSCVSEYAYLLYH